MAKKFPRDNQGPEFQEWRRAVEDRLGTLEDKAALGQSNGTNDNLSRISSFNRLSETVYSQAVTLSGYDYKSGFALAAGWNQMLSIDVPIAPNRNFVTLLAIGSDAVLDMTSGGLATSWAYLSIAGVASPTFPASKDAGASVVQNIHYPSFSLGIALGTLPPGVTSLTTKLYVQPSNPAPFTAQASNFAVLTVIATYSNDSRYPPLP